MALSPVQQRAHVKGGKGGLFGKILGGIAGGIGGFLIGGPGGALTGAGIGSQVGGIAGNAADPAKVKQPKQVSILESSLKTDPQTQLAAMADGQKALLARPDLSVDQAKEGFDYLEEAKKRIKDRMGGFGGTGTSIA